MQPLHPPIVHNTQSHVGGPPQLISITYVCPILGRVNGVHSSQLVSCWLHGTDCLTYTQCIIKGKQMQVGERVCMPAAC